MLFQQIEWDQDLIDDCRQLIRLAVREDLGRAFDITTLPLVPGDLQSRALIAARVDGIVAGLPVAELALQEMNIEATWQRLCEDGDRIEAGSAAAEVGTKSRDLLTAERTLLNFIGRLSGIATLTRRYVDAVADTKAEICDTRKTTPGWRRLEKYAVRCGGGSNHRTGLFDAVLIKDNHLACLQQNPQRILSPPDAVRVARQYLATHNPAANVPIVVEVDTLQQLQEILPLTPDIVLLDNMSRDELQTAVKARDDTSPPTLLEASGGITLENVREVARCGVDRISVGALTHSAASLDFGLDWCDGG